MAPFLPKTTGLPPRRVLVVANETVEGTLLREAVVSRWNGDGSTEILVISPALNSRLRHWVSDVDGERQAAEGRLRRCLECLVAAGVRAEGWVGDANPLQAIDDALHVFGADEIVIATHPDGRSQWLDRDLLGRARTRYSLPIVHVVVENPSPDASRAAA